MNHPWQDFNDAESQPSGYEPIPKGTLLPVRMTLKPGGYDDPAQGWTGGYATRSYETGSVYLAAEFVVLSGEYAKRKLWSNIGLYSPKGPTWAQMGRSFIRAVLNSARQIHPEDPSPAAAAARRIEGFQDLDGLEFVVKVDVELDQKGQPRNVVRQVIEPDHVDYARVMGVPAKPRHEGGANAASSTAPQRAPAPAPPRSPVTGKPSWAQ